MCLFVFVFAFHRARQPSSTRKPARPADLWRIFSLFSCGVTPTGRRRRETQRETESLVTHSHSRSRSSTTRHNHSAIHSLVRSLSSRRVLLSVVRRCHCRLELIDALIAPPLIPSFALPISRTMQNPQMHDPANFRERPSGIVAQASYNKSTAFSLEERVCIPTLCEPSRSLALYGVN